MFYIVETDNFGRDYPDEKFVENIPPLRMDRALEIARIINEQAGPNHSRYWKVVPEGYRLQPGFQP